MIFVFIPLLSVELIIFKMGNFQISVLSVSNPLQRVGISLEITTTSKVKNFHPLKLRVLQISAMYLSLPGDT